MTDAQEWERAGSRPPVELHTDRPHAARVYDVLLGGKTNYPADREAAEQLVTAMPNAALIARHNRAFLHRAARYLAGEAGIRQFLDIGTGIPTSPNLHEVVQSVAPDSRIAYADNDPIVLVHSRALHTSHPEGRTTYIQADLGDPGSVLNSAELRETLDLSRPVALTLIAVLHWLSTEHDPYAVVGELMAALPSGSCLALTHGTADFEPEAVDEVTGILRERGSYQGATRTKDEVRRFFDGLELVEPGVEVVQNWRPDPVDVGEQVPDPTSIPLYAGVARKP